MVVLLVAFGFCGYALVVSAYWMTTDDGLRSAAPSRFAFSLHGDVSKRIPGYVDGRIASGVAETLSVAQITATESPVYGAFFYLQATANLQEAWEADRSLAREAPAVVGREAIDASVRLMLDEGHAHWVKTYWGEDYMEDENCFYRMLLIGCLTAQHKLTGETGHLELLRETVDDLAEDIDGSPFGLVDDYPGQCFPCDVAVAIAIILDADSALGTDRKEWARVALGRMMSNFGGGLPPYTADVRTGAPGIATRGCTNGFFFSHARDIDAGLADALYVKYGEDFWQEKWGAAGWREFPKWGDVPEFYMDPDSGPVIKGFGTGATGLGLGAARKHGDHDRAGKLGAEMLVSAVPMIHGRLLLPWLVSDGEHAPYFAEITILHQLSLSSPTKPDTERAAIPGVVWVLLSVELLVFYALFCVSGGDCCGSEKFPERRCD